MKNTEILRNELKLNLRRDVLQIMRRDPVQAYKIIREMIKEEGEEFILEVFGDRIKLYPGYGFKHVEKNGPLYGREIEETHLKQAIRLESANRLFEIKRFTVGDDWLFFINGQEKDALDKLGLVRGEIHIKFMNEFMKEE